MICWLDDIEPTARQSLEQIQDIINTKSRFPDQIDALARARGWFRPGLPSWQTIPVLDAYLSDILTADHAVEELAIPVEQAWDTELQRFDTEQEDETSAESGLIDLWLGVIHAAKKGQWHDRTDQAHQKLLQLLDTFKRRPDPEIAQNIIPRLDDNFLYAYSDGKLWSNLTLFGLATAESRNDGPAYGSGCTVPEVQAHCNINAFMARMTTTGVREMWDIAMCFMAASTEGRATGFEALDQDKVRIDFRVIYVWLTIAGHEWWGKCCEGIQVPDVPLDINVRSKRCPWSRNPGYNTKVFAKARWRWWRGRFGLVVGSKGDKWSEGSKQLAQEIQTLMENIESGRGA